MYATEVEYIYRQFQMHTIMKIPSIKSTPVRTKLTCSRQIRATCETTEMQT